MATFANSSIEDKESDFSWKRFDGCFSTDVMACDLIARSRNLFWKVKGRDVQKPSATARVRNIRATQLPQANHVFATHLRYSGNLHPLRDCKSFDVRKMESSAIDRA
ncbi:hypothetical protein MPTK1_7g06910 [Marchantia polymorpha subsp. ruderalis]|uniref:Uncharacterized protein n=2 Tax=Marchantia polymorpha TaxID=3197 RepID=A0AAF6BWX1_MARPO|nr:hypothetical protein MARPO_0199s0001 [Marchantia polymorpha]BBN16505.1 hypothetical protein Mp_7g06910 [Marchantia polymorpha subsp. ruderalis]|eukprot:PTQ27411.1 hypothetical protein MARPO_0199s0001 [Marchantia polymorpha]